MSLSLIQSNSFITPHDRYLFNEGSHFELYNKLGAHLVTKDGRIGTHFAVWAPNAEYVSVVGDFNHWSEGSHPLKPQDSSGIWAGFIPNVGSGQCYKYFLRSKISTSSYQKADPFAFSAELPPKSASVIWDLSYIWSDSDWMKTRHQRNQHQAPMSILEVHLGSWMRVPEENNRWLSYQEIAPKLAAHVKKMGFTHVELLPIMEHPFYGSWGYQCLGFFAPTSRYGTPQDFMAFVDTLHQQGIGVILDWVPSHFPTDGHGLGFFDGSCLYEHADERQGFHPDWKSHIFNYGRHEVQSFLISSALFWLDKYHVDGLRVDAVASMLYADYSRKEGEWIPNQHGGRENLEAVSFLKRLNAEVYRNFPDVQTIAEESTAWPMVSRPTSVGGLGFGFKWDMGWMHDMLSFMAKDPIHRRFHHNQLTFRLLYAFNENFILSLSHDEVVHGKQSLLSKMSGDDWQKFSNLRLLFGAMYAMNGKKLLFMGSEFGQWNEWNHESSLDWHLTDFPQHKGVMLWVQDLNFVYQREPALYQYDFEDRGFRWVDCEDAQNSTLSFLRFSDHDTILVVCNFTPVPRQGLRLGVPHAGYWQEILNSDSTFYGGSGMGNLGGLQSDPIPWNGFDHSLSMNLPPLGVLFFKKA